ncbi:histidine phosphatase family protein [Desulfoplanes sp.]
MFAVIVLAAVALVPAVLAAGTKGSLSEGESERLIFAVTVIRHGDRTPFAQLVNDPHAWDIGASQLTAKGMQQQFKLGQKLRKRYVEECALLPATYENGSVYAVANGMNRTIQSAQCLLFGLYPLGSGPRLAGGSYALPSGYQPIPLRTVPEGATLLMESYPDYQKILKLYVFTANEWVNKEEVYRKKFEQWQDILGNEVDGLDDVLTIGDVLIVRKAHGVPLPQGLSHRDEAEIIGLCDWALAFQFKNEKVAQLMGMGLLEQIQEDLEQAATEKKTPRFKLYSGHDTTILPLMKLMGKPLNIPPQYASHLQIELYRTGDNHLVRLRYNGDAIELPVMNNGSCSLKQFLRL